MRSSTAFGVDIGGSGIKGAIVDLEKGDLATERVKYLTPKPSTPEPVAAVVARSPFSRSTMAPLIPLPPMSTPKAVDVLILGT